MSDKKYFIELPGLTRESRHQFHQRWPSDPDTRAKMIILSSTPVSRDEEYPTNYRMLLVAILIFIGVLGGAFLWWVSQ